MMAVTKVPACKNGCANCCILCVDEELARLGEIEKAALNLVMQKGRHNTETAYIRLAALLFEAQRNLDTLKIAPLK